MLNNLTRKVSFGLPNLFSRLVNVVEQCCYYKLDKGEVSGSNPDCRIFFEVENALQSCRSSVEWVSFISVCDHVEASELILDSKI